MRVDDIKNVLIVGSGTMGQQIGFNARFTIVMWLLYDIKKRDAGKGDGKDKQDRIEDDQRRPDHPGEGIGGHKQNKNYRRHGGGCKGRRYRERIGAGGSRA